MASPSFGSQQAIAGLEGVAIAVAAAATIPEIVAAVATAATSLPGAPSVTVGVATGDALRLVALEGFDPTTLDRWGAIPLDSVVPLTDVLRAGQPMYINSRREMLDAYPHLRSDIERSDHHRWAAVPLVSPTGSKGTVGLAWSSAERFSDTERLYMLTLAKLGGEAMRRAGREIRRRDLVIRLAESSDNERVEIARDLHDNSIQQLAAVLIRLGSLRLQNRDDARVEASLRHLERDIQSVIESLRNIITELHPPDVDGLSFVDAVRDFSAWLLAGSLPVEVTDEIGLAMSVEGAREAYRITQEAIANAQKHASASFVRVHVEPAGPNGLRLMVSDDGVGIPDGDDRPGDGHLGVRTMRERAENVGGTLVIDGSSGTRITATIPLQRSSDTDMS